MNYGFSERNRKLSLEPHEEPNRYSMQLYHHIVDGVDLKNKKILEVGSGRGGGLAFLAKKFGPFKGIGLDMDKIAVKFSNRKYGNGKLNFMQGDAQNIPLEDNSVDLILNVESSHRYPNFDKFLKEVHRILKPGGSFMFTDFRYHFQFEDFFKSLESSNLIKVRENNITERVLEALEMDDPRKRRFINKLAPWPINRIALEFAGTVGSHTHKCFSTGQWKYYSYHFRKPDSY